MIIERVNNKSVCVIFFFFLFLVLFLLSRSLSTHKNQSRITNIKMLVHKLKSKWICGVCMRAFVWMPPTIDRITMCSWWIAKRLPENIFYYGFVWPIIRKYNIIFGIHRWANCQYSVFHTDFESALQLCYFIQNFN